MLTHRLLVSASCLAGLIALLSVAAYLSRQEKPSSAPDQRAASVDEVAEDDRPEERSTESVARSTWSASLLAEIEQSSGTIAEKVRRYAPHAPSEPEIGIVLARQANQCLVRTSPDHLDAMVDTEVPPTTVDELISTEEACGALSRDVLIEILGLLEIAASRGIRVDDRPAEALYYLQGGVLVGSDQLANDVGIATRYRGNALAFLNTSAAKGDAESIYWLSLLFEEGHLVTRDPAAALRLHDAFIAARGRSSALFDQRRVVLVRAAQQARDVPR